jgi:anti-sigma-K factor RskA
MGGASTRTTHSEVRDQAAAFALGALNDADRMAFEAHLLTCGECDDEFRSFARVVSVLSGSSPRAEPSSSIRDKIVNATRDTPAPRAPSARLAWLPAAAALALAAGLGVYAVAVERRAPDAHLLVVMSADDLVRVDLAGQSVAPDARARVFWSRSRGLIFTGSRLPPLPPGRTYQLWIISGEMPVGAGLLKPRADGSVQATFSSPNGLMKAAAFAVTSEPNGGVVVPTGDKYLVGLVN